MFHNISGVSQKGRQGGFSEAGSWLVGGGQRPGDCVFAGLALRLAPSPLPPGFLPTSALPMPHPPEFPTSWHPC